MLTRFLYRKCRKCGTPRIVGRMYRWGNDGTLGLKFRDEIKREVFLNASMYDDLMEEINREIGKPVWHLVYEANRNVSKTALEDMFNSNDLLNKLKNRKTVRRLIIQFFHELSALKGFCVSSTYELDDKGAGIAYVKNPFNIYPIGATIVAAFEAVDQKPYKCTWEELGLNEYLVKGSQTDEKPAISERLSSEVPSVVEGRVKLERCPSCGIPIRAAQLLNWNRSEGIITHKLSGDRFCSFLSSSLPPVFRELATELGDEIYDFLVTTQCEWTMSHLDRLGITGGSGEGGDQGEDSFEKYLGDFPVLGYGNPILYESDESSCSVTIENPFFKEMVAGILLGLFKGLYGRDAQISWKDDGEGKVRYIIKSA